MVAAVIAVMLVVAVLAAYLISSRTSDDQPLDDALDLLRRETSFDSSTEAVVHFADVYQHLVDAAATFPKDCDVDAGRGRCLAINQAASWSLNFSPASGHCTQPAIQEGRIALLDYVTQANGLDDAEPEPPPLPPLPSC